MEALETKIGKKLKIRRKKFQRGSGRNFASGEGQRRGDILAFRKYFIGSPRTKRRKTQSSFFFRDSTAIMHNNSIYPPLRNVEFKMDSSIRSAQTNDYFFLHKLESLSFAERLLPLPLNGIPRRRSPFGTFLSLSIHGRSPPSLHFSKKHFFLLFLPPFGNHHQSWQRSPRERTGSIAVGIAILFFPRTCNDFA